MPENASGWRMFTPHEFAGALVVLATALEMIEYFPPGSQGAKLVSLAILVAAMTGIASAQKYMPPRIKAILAERDVAAGEVKTTVNVPMGTVNVQSPSTTEVNS